MSVTLGTAVNRTAKQDGTRACRASSKAVKTARLIRPEDKLSHLRNVKGNISIENGIATFEDGTTLTL